MSTSKQLITALEKADWLDRLLILASLGFFVLVVLFILKQRIVDRGLRVVLWWTRFVPDFSGDAALLASEKGVRKASTLASAVSATTAASVKGALGSAVSATTSLLSAPLASVGRTQSQHTVYDGGDSLDPVEQALSALSVSGTAHTPSAVSPAAYDHGNAPDPVEDALSSLTLTSSTLNPPAVSTSTEHEHHHVEL